MEVEKKEKEPKRVEILKTVEILREGGRRGETHLFMVADVSRDVVNICVNPNLAKMPWSKTSMFQN